MKLSTSLGVGGKPVRSIESLLIRVNLSASGEGARPIASSFASTKLSMGLRTQLLFFTVGTVGRTGATKAQCELYCAP